VVRLAALIDRLGESLWLLPGLFVIGAVILASVLMPIDRQLQAGPAPFFAFGGTAEGARIVLSAIAQSMLTFTALVFSITMLVLQLASSQLSPRVLRTFLRDRPNQIVLGLFVATFLFSLIVLGEVRSPDDQGGFVPRTSISVTFVLLLASVAAFIYHIDHMAHAIRADTVIRRIADETRRTIDEIYPEGASPGAQPGTRPSAQLGAEPPATSHAALRGDVTGGQRTLPDDGRIVASDRVGTVLAVDEARLVALATEADALVELLPIVGDFIPYGSPLLTVQSARAGTPPLDAGPVAVRGGHGGRDIDERLRRAVTIGPNRTMKQDAAFGFRQLVDVAARALSPGTNDPTTAVQAIDQLHDLLRRLASRPFPGRTRTDRAGIPRLVMNRFEWDAFVHLAVDELRLYGITHFQVSARLRSMLVDLATVCPPERAVVVREALERLGEAEAEESMDPADVAAAAHGVRVRDVERSQDGPARATSKRAGARSRS
jgi:uncharacterized membrane protein